MNRAVSILVILATCLHNASASIRSTDSLVEGTSRSMRPPTGRPKDKYVAQESPREASYTRASSPYAAPYGASSGLRTQRPTAQTSSRPIGQAHSPKHPDGERVGVYPAGAAPVHLAQDTIQHQIPAWIITPVHASVAGPSGHEDRGYAIPTIANMEGSQYSSIYPMSQTQPMAETQRMVGRQPVLGSYPTRQAQQSAQNSPLTYPQVFGAFRQIVTHPTNSPMGYFPLKNNGKREERLDHMLQSMKADYPSPRHGKIPVEDKSPESPGSDSSTEDRTVRDQSPEDYSPRPEKKKKSIQETPGLLMPPNPSAMPLEAFAYISTFKWPFESLRHLQRGEQTNLGVELYDRSSDIFLFFCGGPHRGQMRNPRVPRHFEREQMNLAKWYETQTSFIAATPHVFFPEVYPKSSDDLKRAADLQKWADWKLTFGKENRIQVTAFQAMQTKAAITILGNYYKFTNFRKWKLVFQEDGSIYKIFAGLKAAQNADSIKNPDAITSLLTHQLTKVFHEVQLFPWANTLTSVDEKKLSLTQDQITSYLNGALRPLNPREIVK